MTRHSAWYRSCQIVGVPDAAPGLRCQVSAADATVGDRRRHARIEVSEYRGTAVFRAWNVSRVVVHMQRDLGHLEVPERPSGLTVRSADPGDPRDDAIWRDLVSRSYPDVETVPPLRSMFEQHRFLAIDQVWLVAQDQPVATIALGRFKSDPRVAGVARIAVLPSARGQGIGRWMIVAAYAELATQGCALGESVITNTRQESLRLHARSGWSLQSDPSLVQDVGQRRRWPAKALAVRRARRHIASVSSAPTADVFSR